MSTVGVSVPWALAVSNKTIRATILRMTNNVSGNAAVLAAHDISKEVSSPEGSLTILADVSFSIAAGATVAVVGPSGAGKSTLLALLAGLDLPTRGHVVLNGANLGELDEDGRARVRAESVGFVFQSFHLVPSLNALENVMLPLELAENGEARGRALAMLERVGLAARTHHYPKHLSGGEQQRVALARAFVSRPKILLADEPTGSLDAATGAEVINLMFDLNVQFGTTLVLVTHDEQLAARCTRVVRLAGGEIVG